MNDEKALDLFASYFFEIFFVYGILGYFTISSGIEKYYENLAEK